MRISSQPCGLAPLACGTGERSFCILKESAALRANPNRLRKARRFSLSTHTRHLCRSRLLDFMRLGDQSYPPAEAEASEATYDRLTAELRERVLRMWEELREGTAETRAIAT